VFSKFQNSNLHGPNIKVASNYLEHAWQSLKTNLSHLT
jgi:hypothetical protein